MFDKRIKLLSVSMTLTILLSSFPLLYTIVVAQAVPSVFVDPLENFFYTDTTSVGTEFSITIEAADWPEPGVYSFEFKLYYDPTMLEPVPAKIGVDPDFWITAFVAASGLDEGAPFVDGEGNPFLWFSATLLGAGGKVGGGILAKAGFKIIAEPAAGQILGQILSCGLDLRDVIMVDPSTSPPTGYPEDYYEVQSGIYQYSGPPPPHYLKIEPAIVTATEVGDEVSITVMIYDVEEDQQIIGAEFKVFFEPSILSIMSVMEGDFFKAFGTTFSVNYTFANYGLVGILLLPTEGGQHITFPQGSGSLATIKFEVIALPEELTEFPLDLGDVQIVARVEDELTVLPPRSIEDAVLMAPTRREDLNQDGIVNVLDMATFALAFGSGSGDPRWNPMADIDQNGIVNILDGVMVARAFGS